MRSDDRGRVVQFIDCRILPPPPDQFSLYVFTFGAFCLARRSGGPHGRRVANGKQTGPTRHNKKDTARARKSRRQHPDGRRITMKTQSGEKTCRTVPKHGPEILPAGRTERKKEKTEKNEKNKK